MKRCLAVVMVLLGGVGTLSAQQRSAPLLLNHLYAVLDSATYAEVMASPFLTTQFAGFKSRSPATWFGRHTYLEFFDPHGFDSARVGDVGIALGVEVAGGLAEAARRFTTLGAPFDSTTENRGTPQQRERYVHRFQPAKADAPSPRTAFWVMEYTLEASRALAVRDSLPLGDLGRDRFLMDRFDSSKLLGDITGATLAIPVEDIAAVIRAVQRLGGEVISEGEGAIVRLPSFTLRLLPAWERPGLRRLEFNLVREATANPVFRFGQRSRLRFGPGRIAVWDFALP
jgi:hypothetical protein